MVGTGRCFVCVFLFVALVFSQVCPADAQYSRAEMDRAIRALSDRGLLDAFIAKYKADPSQTVTRADLLIVSYEIVLAMASNTRSLTDKIDKLGATLKARPDRAGPGFDQKKVSDMVAKQVEETFPHLIDNAPTIAHLRKEIAILKESARGQKVVKGESTATETLRREVNYNRVIAGTSVVVALTSALLIAR